MTVFYQTHLVNRLDFIKCDVEGFEFNVFSGGKNTLSRFKPPIFCEIDKTFCARNNIETTAVFELLFELGYQAYLPTGTDRLYSVVGFESTERKAEFFFIHHSQLKTFRDFLISH